MVTAMSSVSGLSPRLRGNPMQFFPPLVFVRSIPAPAGEPLNCKPPKRLLRVYPRACGGTGNTVPLRRGQEGLSPRLRGNPIQEFEDYAAIGSIPAPAGEPLPAGLKRPTIGVYPRACGGTIYERVAYNEKEGLSPRLRGNLVG